MSPSEDRDIKSRPVIDSATRPHLFRTVDSLEAPEPYRPTFRPVFEGDKIPRKAKPEATPRETTLKGPKIDDPLLVSDTPPGMPLVRQISMEGLGETGKEYIERLEKLDFGAEGNPYLKATIIQRVKQWESRPRPVDVARLASLMDKNPKEVEELLQQRVEELMGKCQFFRATETGIFLNHILRGEQRYKSQFEVRTSGGRFDPTYRSEMEEKQFGFPPSYTQEGMSAVQHRPVYGYFSLNENGIINDKDAHPPTNFVDSYGRVTVKIKKGVAMRRATMHLMDSLYADAIPLCPVALPHFSTVFLYDHFTGLRLERTKRFLEQPISTESLRGITGSYTDIQFHGGLTVGDIESVHLSLGNGLFQKEIDEVAEAVKAYNQETGNNMAVVIYK